MPSRDTRRLAAALADIAALLGDRLKTGEAIRHQHATSVTWLPPSPPDAVAFPGNEDEVARIVRICARERVPVIAFGAGTSLEGHVNAPFGGISIDTSGLDKIHAVSVADMDCRIGPGVTRKRLNQHVASDGLFFPVDPGADASLGGMAATRASGTSAVRYGTMRDNVLALRVVTAAGEVVVTGTRARKSSAGYDLTRLFVGAEGTLGVITELTLRLHGLPEAISAGVCAFPDVTRAAEAAIMAIASGLPIARVELMDAAQIRASNAYSKLTLPETAHLFLEFHGSEAGVAEQATRFGEIAAEHGGSTFEWATRAEDRSRLWQARHDAFWAARALRPGCEAFSTDVCVPIAALAPCIEATRADLEATGLTATIIGHVGDGNFHVLPVIDMADAAEVGRAKAFSDRLVERALAMGGTSTGEHGIGEGKRAYLARELGPGAVALMRAVKTALDPDGIMNPGKILPGN